MAHSALLKIESKASQREIVHVRGGRHLHAIKETFRKSAFLSMVGSCQLFKKK